MNQDLLLDAFQSARKKTDFDNNHMLEVERKSIGRVKTAEITGAGNLLIAVEELSELITELTLAASGHPDELAILEETIDVELTMDYVRILCGLSEYYGSVSPDVKPEYESQIGTLAAMQKQITKFLRGKGNPCAMAECVVRTLHVLYQIEEKYRFTGQDIQAMKTVKINRMEQKMERMIEL